MLDLTVYDFICVTRTDAQTQTTVFCPHLSLSLFLSLSQSLGGALLTCEFCEFANFITGAIGFTFSRNSLKTVRTKTKS